MYHSNIGVQMRRMIIYCKVHTPSLNDKSKVDDKFQQIYIHLVKSLMLAVVVLLDKNIGLWLKYS
jgi:hypothetical protein